MSTPDKKNFCGICEQMIIPPGSGVEVAVSRVTKSRVHAACAEAACRAYRAYVDRVVNDSKSPKTQPRSSQSSKES